MITTGEHFHTENPDALTVGDLSRWCEELARFIREHPDDTDGIRARADDLHRLITAAAHLIECLPPESNADRLRREWRERS